MEKHEFLMEADGGTNIIFTLRRVADESLWICKLFKNSKGFAEGCADLNARAVLCCRLANSVGTCVPGITEIFPWQIIFSPLFDRFLFRAGGDLIHQRKLLIIRFSGISLGNYLKLAGIEDLKNIPEILQNFVFNLWVGNYDKKTDDYVIDNDLVCSSIDYSLSGPGFVEDETLSIGAFFQTYNMNIASDSGWALADIFVRELRAGKAGPEVFLPMIERIERLPESTVRDAFEGLRFYRYGTAENINTVYVKFLLQRRGMLRKAVQQWASEGYPRGERVPGK